MIVDIGMFMNWLNAYSEGRAEVAAFHERRFRPEFAPASQAWVATSARRKHDAASSPFALKEYRLAERDRAAAFTAAALDRFDQGRPANKRGDDYVRLAVILGTVLFLAGSRSRCAPRPFGACSSASQGGCSRSRSIASRRRRVA